MIELVYTREPQQVLSTEKMRELPGFFDMSDPGTGKTFTEIFDFANRRNAGGGRGLIIAQKSIMQSAWGDEIDRAAPGMMYGLATAANREQPFLDSTHDVVIINPAGLKLLQTKPQLLKGFDSLMIDESTVIKNPDTQTFKIVRKIAQQMAWRRCMTGTPNPNTVLDFWTQAYILDRGERLSDSYWKFRNVACTPKQVGPDPRHIEWVDKEGIENVVFDLLSDISIRHKLEGVPENRKTHHHFKMSAHARRIYDKMVKHAVAELDDRGTEVTAVHAAALMQKLLQIAAGAVYTGEEYSVVCDGRTELIMDLLEERRHSLVLFQWRHQRDLLVAAAKKRGWEVAVIDGDTPDAVRPQIVRDFQAGKYKAIFAHPKSAGHGLTLTRGTTTIWASPTWSSELFVQANARIHRKGQTERTETIMISAEDTVDREVYERLGGKLHAMELILSLMEMAR
jgi:SNF2 family DNA or RNA helicase